MTRSRWSAASSASAPLRSQDRGPPRRRAWPHLADINARGSPNGALWNVRRAGVLPARCSRPGSPDSLFGDEPTDRDSLASMPMARSRGLPRAAGSGRCPPAEAIRVGSLRARVGHGYQLLRLTLERKAGTNHCKFLSSHPRVPDDGRDRAVDGGRQELQPLRPSGRDYDPDWLSPRLAGVRVVRSAMVAD
jgi:hypothetical protein